MSWTSVYRLALRLLPAGLRDKHGLAMEVLFAREIENARAHGWSSVAYVGMASVWDVARRSVYEQMRSQRDTVGEPTARELLRRHATSFATAFVALTALLLARFATRELPALRAPGTPSSVIVEALLFAVPFTAALTIPMAVLVAVLWEFTRLGADGTLAVARKERAGLRRLVVPVMCAAAGVAALAFVVTAEIVPRANERLVTVLAQRATPLGDRMMTIGQLRTAARAVEMNNEPLAVARAARYEVEIQKKLALPAACVVLALAGVAISLSVSRGRVMVVAGASLAVFLGYYALMITGENLANRLIISPFVGMWGANALLLGAALLAGWRGRARVA